MTHPTSNRATPPPGSVADVVRDDLPAGAWSRARDLAAALPELGDSDWSALAAFDNALHRALGADVGDGGVDPTAARVPMATLTWASDHTPVRPCSA